MSHDRAMVSSRQWGLLFVGWLLAVVSTVGSLFFSEVMDYVPCVLCWYQRIPMYALAVILGIALVTQDVNVVKYAQPLALIGVALAAFHCLLYLGYVPKGIQPCSQDIPCSEVKLQVWGFLTIPLMSLAAFLAIVFVLFLLKRSKP
ncbi:disulfide bond formation protein B [Comamonadaceae bacterium G21597-S1]|nr:disulfide bond formation protein B [Comamonadaceae bacterium G21597-S1]